MKPIEVEVRAEIRVKEIERITRALRASGFRHASTTRRTSVMSYGQAHAKGRGWNHHRHADIDIRCRITNGHAEVVAKIGETHAANRIEISQEVSMAQMIAFATMFGQMGFFTKVGSKFTENYRNGSVIISIVQSPSGIAYVEMEEMSNRAKESKTLQRLKTLAERLGLDLIKSRNAFLELCDRLTKKDDWEFRGTARDVQRLNKEIIHTGSNKK